MQEWEEKWHRLQSEFHIQIEKQMTHTQQQIELKIVRQINTQYYKKKEESSLICRKKEKAAR